MPIPCLLDCDPGHDDAIAILLAARSPTLDLRAITTVAGNGTLANVTRNALQVATLAGIRDVPVAAGADRPLRRALVIAPDIHGASGLDGPRLPDPAVALDPRPADELIAALARESGEPVTLVAIGPLTNIATVLERHPGVARHIREIVLMGGSTERGNVTPYAEFNIYVDPEAADVVFSSGAAVTMVGLNLTHQALATPSARARLRATGTETGRVAAEWLDFFAGTYDRVHHLPDPPVHDPCAVALLIEPDVVRTVEAFVGIETEGRYTRGATVVDLDGRLGRPANARVAMELDVERFWDLVVAAVA
jgi:purine nucleosidase